MKYWVALTLIVFCGCSVKVATPARAFVTNKDKQEVFDFVLQAVAEAGFVTSLANKDAGIITAQDVITIISCKVQETADGVLVDVNSMRPGMVAYGSTKNAIEELFKRLSVYLPKAVLSIDGKPYTPGAPTIQEAKDANRTMVWAMGGMGGALAFSRLSRQQFDRASDNEAEAALNRAHGQLSRAQKLDDKADRARLYGWSTAVLAAGSFGVAGVALISRKTTHRVFPGLSFRDGEPRVGVSYVYSF